MIMKRFRTDASKYMTFLNWQIQMRTACSATADEVIKVGDKYKAVPGTVWVTFNARDTTDWNIRYFITDSVQLSKIGIITIADVCEKLKQYEEERRYTMIPNPEGYCYLGRRGQWKVY